MRLVRAELFILRLDPDVALEFTWIHEICYHTSLKFGN